MLPLLINGGRTILRCSWRVPFPDTCWIAARAWPPNQPGPDGIWPRITTRLIPVKLLAFDAAVNTTLELPFLRTSPTTAPPSTLQAKGRPESTTAALQAAWDLS